MKSKKTNWIIRGMCMLISIVCGMCIGLFLGWLSLPKSIICGSVAIVSTVMEHFLTIHENKIINFLSHIEEGFEDEDL